MISITISLSIVGVFYIVMCTDSKNNAFLNTMMSTLNRIPGGRGAARAVVNAYVRLRIERRESHTNTHKHTHTHTGIHVFQKKSDSSDCVLGSSGWRILNCSQ